MGYILNNIINSPFKDLNYSYISSDYGPRSFYNNITGYTCNADLKLGGDVLTLAAEYLRFFL